MVAYGNECQLIESAVISSSVVSVPRVHLLGYVAPNVPGTRGDGLAKRTVYPTMPPKVEYQLTHVGRSLIEPLSALASWAQANLPVIEAARATNEDVESAETI
nr:helix-turn-helix domain-containing protein [Acidovorax delafieldii]